MFYIICKDQGEWVLSSKRFATRDDAAAYAKTISPSRDPRVLQDVTEQQEAA